MNCERAGEIRAEPVSVLRSPEYLRELAEFYSDLELSGELTADWIIDQICLYHEGRLLDPRGQPIVMDHFEPAELFGEDTRRTINAFKKQAMHSRRQCLHRRLLPRLMALDLARKIYSARCH